MNIGLDGMNVQKELVGNNSNKNTDNEREKLKI